VEVIYLIDERQSFAEMLRNVIAEKKATINELSVLFGVSTSSIYGWKSTDTSRWAGKDSLPERWVKLQSFLDGEIDMKYKVNGKGLVTSMENDNNSVHNAIQILAGKRNKYHDEMEELETRLREIRSEDEKLEQAIATLRSIDTEEKSG